MRQNTVSSFSDVKLLQNLYKLTGLHTMLLTLVNREKTIILISNAITMYSQKLQEGTIPQNQSVIDFIRKTIPENLRSELSVELIDDVFSFISNSHVELS